MVDSVQIVLFGVGCGVGTDKVSQELLIFLHALRDVESDVRIWCRSPLRTPEVAAGPLRGCCRQVMPAARIPAAGTSVDRASCCLRRKA